MEGGRKEAVQSRKERARVAFHSILNVNISRASRVYTHRRFLKVVNRASLLIVPRQHAFALARIPAHNARAPTVDLSSSRRRWIIALDHASRYLPPRASDSWKLARLITTRIVGTGAELRSSPHAGSPFSLLMTPPGLPPGAYRYRPRSRKSERANALAPKIWIRRRRRS